MEHELDHEKLEVYRKAKQAFAECLEAIVTIPAGHEALRDQLRRASLSVMLNIAEGAEKFSPKDKQRYYRTARGSASECSAGIDAAMLVDGAKWKMWSAIQMQYKAIVGMLTGLVLAVEKRK